MTDYVAGFMFTEDANHVALIEKQRPDWQRLKLNGIGGHVEANESPKDAMIREFEEEAGVHYEDWELFARLSGDFGTVFFYRAFSDTAFYLDSKTDEEINLYAFSLMDYSRCIPNLSFLLPIARYRHDNFDVVDFKEIN